MAKISVERKQQCLKERREKDKAARVSKAEEKQAKATASVAEGDAGVKNKGDDKAKDAEKLVKETPGMDAEA
ncbi:hypothetical protein Pyn_29885 [Prunus yedoensis var. nudiflora]|uniref:Uncharacterized protein n=1 Tax=Prunus yedoensis var. nudiflora TaxID=2094558 RepID=A0A314Y5I9_PRUYE|nr:hypothetical protein Pyn_29885 [Prunus yedoensis var. nudiflora]